MKLKDQVCTFEQAKRLKELGVSQCGYFVIGETQPDNPIESWTVEDEDTFYSAFTVAELSIMLPDYHPSWRFKITGSSQEKVWVATIIREAKPAGDYYFHTCLAFDRIGNTQAEALATLLIALIETKAIIVDEINARL